MNNMRRILSQTFGLESKSTVSNESAIDPLDRNYDQVGEVVKAVNDMRDIQDVRRETNEVVVGLEQLHDTLALINARGGVDKLGFEFATITLESYMERVGLTPPKILTEGLQFSDDQPRHHVSLEELNEAIDQIKGGQEKLVDVELDGVDHLCEVLQEALPAAVDAVQAAKQAAEQATDREGGATVASHDFHRFLLVDGEIPSDMPAYFQKLGQFHECCHGEFFTQACEAARSAATAAGNADFSSSETFESSVRALVEGVKDPRGCLTGELGDVCLPGSGPVFADDEPSYDGSSELFKSIDQTNCTSAPCDPTRMAVSATEETEMPALTPSQVITIADSLLQALAAVSPSSIKEQGKQSLATLTQATEGFVQKYNAAADTLRDAVAEEADVVVDYLDNLKQMVEQVPLDCAANLIQTAHAFAAYAERSLSAWPASA